MNAEAAGSGKRRPKARNPFVTTADQSDDAPPKAAPPAGPNGEDGSAVPPPTESGARPGHASGDVLPAFGRWEIPVDGVSVHVADMAHCDFAEPPHEALPLTITTRAEPNGQWRATLTWPAWTGKGVAVFRVIAADGRPPESAADNLEATLDVTTSSSIADATAVNPPGAGIRYYEVWAHLGADISSAVATPPYLYSGGTVRDKVVWPPIGLRVTPQGHQLVLSWDAIAGQKFRFKKLSPVDARRGRPRSAECDDLSSRGHVDDEVTPGQDYVYYLYAGVRGTEVTDWSDQPAVQRAAVPVQLDPVMDLDAEPVADSVVDLVWETLPVGRVEVYQSELAPPADIHTAGQVTFEDLARYPYNLDLHQPVRNPVQDDGEGRSRMANVAISSEQAAVFFTPLTRFDQQARPGKPLRWLRADPPSDLLLVDRVEQVLIAFRWPPGAARVDVWRTPPDVPPPDPSRSKPFMSMGREDYNAFGGFLIRRDIRFGSGPCALHLAGFSQHGGSGKHSAVATIHGTFPIVIHYHFEVERKQRFRGVKVRHRLILQSNEALAGAEFSLVWSERFLPLTRGDGSVLGTWPVTLQSRQALGIDIPNGLPTGGFMRLIAETLHEPAIALIDPPLSQLRLGHG